MAQNEKEQNDYRITYYNTVSSKELIGYGIRIFPMER